MTVLRKVPTLGHGGFGGNLMDEVPVAVILTDLEGLVTYWNRHAEALCGWSREEAIGRTIADLLVPEAEGPEARRILDRLRAGETWEGEVQIRRKSGSLTLCRIADAPLRDEDGVVGGMVRIVMEASTRTHPAARPLEGTAALGSEARDQLEAIFNGVAEGITVQDSSGQVVFANEAAARTLGFETVDELLATPLAAVMERFELWDEGGEPFPPEQLPGRLALLGVAGSERIVRFRDNVTGEDQWAQVKASPLYGEDGTVRFAINIFHDVTDQQLAQDTQRFLAEASEVLALSLDFDETLKQIARLAVPRLADWCAISIREEDGSIRQLAVEHVDPAKVGLAEELGRKYPTNQHAQRGVPGVLRTGRSELYPQIAEALLEESARDEEHLQILRSIGLRSAMIVPMVARSRAIGAITFVGAESGRRYGPEDLRLAEDLAQRAALAVDNARLFRERSAVADALQKSLLPPRLPSIPRTEIAARYYAAGQGNEVGGDFYDAFPTGEGSWALVIGDVCGKGPEAAAVTGLARHTIRAAAIQERRPSNVLATLNDAVMQQRSDHIFCTVCYMRLKLNPKNVRATICCAGHPLPLVLRANGRVETAGAPGTLLGIFPNPSLADRAVDLAPGDAVVLFTDGLIEGHGDGASGRDRLISIVRASAGLDAASMAERIEQTALSLRPGPPRDDMALLVLRIRP
jgi:PAS domain S-box-containing protein